MSKYNSHFLLIKNANSGKYSSYQEHNEANDYYGCQYCYNGNKYIQRTAKITPKKIGQFVTLWKRNTLGITSPFTASEELDFVIILCFKDKKMGRFIFSKDVLIKNGILSEMKEGKRGFRVYPQWDTPQNKQAIKTQVWQLEYFDESLLLN